MLRGQLRVCDGMVDTGKPDTRGHGECLIEPMGKPWRLIMLSAEAKDAVSAELKRIAASLNLSEDQKKQLHTSLENAREKLDEIRKAHPDITKADVIEKLKSVRVAARERVVKFLTPDQLTKWDAEVAKAKSFLGINA
jgi:periplasmic protein CpxP/Spy